MLIQRMPWENTPLSCAATNGHEKVVKQLVEHGVDVNLRDMHGMLPLSRAAQRGHTEIVRTVLERDGIGLTLKDKNNDRTLLSYAAENGHEDLVDLLLYYSGIDINSKDISGKTPLSLAALNGHEAVVKLLIVRGVQYQSKR